MSKKKLCGWCKKKPARRTWCGRRCRQSAWRYRQRTTPRARTDEPLRLAYADPPYPGFAWKLYRRREVNHKRLIAKLVKYDGWALSTAAKSLNDILPLCPPEARVCAWVKPIHGGPNTYGIHNTWEPVIVMPGRRLQPGTQDWLHAHTARRGGTLVGRKPIAFCAWIFDLLGAQPGDSLDDLFPGTGIIGKAWDELSRQGKTTVAPAGTDAASG